MILVQKVFGYPDEICYKFNLILILLKSTYLCINNFTLTLPLARLSGSQPTFRLRGEWVGILIVHYCSIPRISVFGYSWEIRIHLGLKFCLRALEQWHFLVGILQALHISSRLFEVMNYLLYPDLQKKNGLLNGFAFYKKKIKNK